MHAAGAAHQDVACESGSSADSASDECYYALVDLVQLAARAALCGAPWGTSVGLACRETRLAGAVGVRSGGASVTTGSDQAHLEREMVTCAREGVHARRNVSSNARRCEPRFGGSAALPSRGVAKAWPSVAERRREKPKDQTGLVF